jgi:hypothetical protein
MQRCVAWTAKASDNYEEQTVTRTLIAGAVMWMAAGSVMAAAATCTSTQSLSELGPPGIATFGNSFSSAGSYVDCYTFTLNAPATSFGGVIEIDPLFNKLDIDITDIALYAGDTRLVDTMDNPLLFGFQGLLGGAGSPMFMLALSSVVTTDPGWRDRPVAYAGAIMTGGVEALPEPGPLALLVATGLGLLAVRRKALD